MTNWQFQNQWHNGVLLYSRKYWIGNVIENKEFATETERDEFFATETEPTEREKLLVELGEILDDMSVQELKQELKNFKEHNAKWKALNEKWGDHYTTTLA